MAAPVYLYCLSTDGGVPLFCKTYGNHKPLPLPIIGSLNSVDTFCSSVDSVLHSTCSDEYLVVWKRYVDSITLILVLSNQDDSTWFAEQLLDLVFNAMVLLYGLDDITNMKADLQMCHRLIDSLIDTNAHSAIPMLTSAATVICGPETVILQTNLEAFSETGQSMFACVMVNDHMAVMNNTSTTLSAVELVLLQQLVKCLPPCSARDMPVFLPQLSPQVAHRMLTFALLPGVQVVLICGAVPSLADLERKVEAYWQSAVNSLSNLISLSPRNLSTAVKLDEHVLGLLIVNTRMHVCISSVSLDFSINSTQATNLPSNEKKTEINRRYKALVKFYRSVVCALWSLKDLTQTSSGLKSRDSCSIHKVSDTFMVTKKYKFYAFESEDRRAFIIYSNKIPTYAMRLVSQQTLTTIQSEPWFIV